jgi:hypothetical protein
MRNPVSRSPDKSHVIEGLPGEERMPGGSARLAERSYNPVVFIDDDIAMVWAQYDFLIDGKAYHWGTNNLSLLKQNGHWRVSAIADNGRTGLGREIGGHSFLAR